MTTGRRGSIHRAALFLIVLLGLSSYCRPKAEFQVVRVIDGDTIVIENNERVRYIGMDTPELARGKRPAEPYADEAKAFNQRLVGGKRVRLEFDKEERDRFGRLLAYVYVGEVMVNEELVRSGLARAAAYPPNLRYRSRFEKLEEEAKEDGRGIWGKSAR